jgi:hypothetical protein
MIHARVRLILLIAVLAYPFWLAMMVFHELGHVCGALATGGTVTGVSIPLLGFSRTDVWPNPWPRVEVWCGPIVGGLLPLVIAGALRRTRIRSFAVAFAGWCLIANGAYIGLGWIYHAGDAGDLLRLSTPRWLMVGFGVFWFTGGLFLWDRLGRSQAGPAVEQGAEGRIWLPAGGGKSLRTLRGRG